jgi:hypothetical protein
MPHNHFANEISYTMVKLLLPTPKEVRLISFTIVAVEYFRTGLFTQGVALGWNLQTPSALERVPLAVGARSGNSNRMLLDRGLE